MSEEFEEKILKVKGDKNSFADTELKAYWENDLLNLNKGFMTLVLSRNQANKLGDFLTGKQSAEKEINSLRRQIEEEVFEHHNTVDRARQQLSQETQRITGIIENMINKLNNECITARRKESGTYQNNRIFTRQRLKELLSKINNHSQQNKKQIEEKK